jgi:putative ABC transport system substrate-binding protein
VLRQFAGSLAILIAFVLNDAAEAQPKYRMGFLTVTTPSGMAARVERFRQGLRELGYVEGQNLTIEYRWGEGRSERLPALALELINAKVDLMVTHGVLATQAAQKASATVPIICFACGDAVAVGLVRSLARPGGNVTGQTVLAPEVSGKRVELLREVVPALSTVAVLYNAGNPVSKPELNETESAIRTLGFQIRSVSANSPQEFGSAFESLRGRAEALVVLSDAMFFGNRKQIADFAIRNKLSAISWSGEFAKAGLLMSYGPDVYTMAQRAAVYVDKVLKGVHPSAIPIEQPTKFELMINAKTARTIGLTIPPALLARADEVIE